jgi:hypothetical protein
MQHGRWQPSGVIDGTPTQHGSWQPSAVTDRTLAYHGSWQTSVSIMLHTTNTWLESFLMEADLGGGDISAMGIIGRNQFKNLDKYNEIDLLTNAWVNL